MTTDKMSKIKLFKTLGNYCSDTHRTRIVNCDEFIEEYDKLRFGNGGSWARFDGNFGKKYKAVSIKKNGNKIVPDF